MDKNNNNYTAINRLAKWGVAFYCFSAAALAEQIDDTRDLLKQWVEVEKTISAEQSAWDGEKALLNDVLASLNQEERLLRQSIDSAQQDTSRADEERLELISRREAYQQNSNVFQERLELYEMQAQQLTARLPSILKDETSQLIARLFSTEGSSYSLSERAQTLISFLSAVQDFDSSITVANEIRSLSNSDEVEVKVLYLGLSRAFYADPAKRTAGIGAPIEGGSEDGWAWTEQTDLADEIMRAVDIYENKDSPALVSLPLVVQQN